LKAPDSPVFSDSTAAPDLLFSGLLQCSQYHHIAAIRHQRHLNLKDLRSPVKKNLPKTLSYLDLYVDFTFYL
jgi:hypothetical protein